MSQRYPALRVISNLAMQRGQQPFLDTQERIRREGEALRGRIMVTRGAKKVADHAGVEAAIVLLENLIAEMRRR